MARIIGFGQSPLTAQQRAALGVELGAQGFEWMDFAVEGADEARLAECEALVGNFSQEQLQRAEKLVWLQVAPAGVERFVAPGALREDVILTNGSGAYGIAIAEYMLGGLLMLMRRMATYLDNQRLHKWVQFPGIRTLYGSKVTVVGAGNLGQSFAVRCSAMGAKVTGVRRAHPEAIPDGFSAMFSTDQLDEAIADADVVALCLPATAQTVGLFDGARLSKMKRGAMIINVGRGSALDASALIEALASGQLGGALLDVTDPEPLPENHPLWDAPNLILTPHISGIDRDRLAAGMVYEIIRENLLNYAQGLPLRNIVDRGRGY